MVSQQAPSAGDGSVPQRTRGNVVIPVLAAAAYVFGFAWVLHVENWRVAALVCVIAPLLLGGVIGRRWATGIPLLLLVLLLVLLAIFPPGEESEASVAGVAAVAVVATAMQCALVAAGVAFRRLMSRLRKDTHAAHAPEPRSKGRRILHHLLAATTSLFVLVFVLLTLTLFLPTSFGVFSARNWERPVPNDDRSLPVSGGMSELSRIEPLFGRIASQMAYRETEVRCWSGDDWKYRPRYAGYFSPKNRTIHLPPRVCLELTRLAYEHRLAGAGESSIGLARALNALAHESMHAAGYMDEAEAECYAMQSIRWTAGQLGARKDEAGYLATLYWEKRYPNIPDSDYRSHECRDGGRLDVQPGVEAWP